MMYSALLLIALAQTGPDEMIRHHMKTADYAQKDPSISLADATTIRTLRFGANEVVRVQPWKSGIPVVGADRVFVVRGEDIHGVVEAPLRAFPSFHISRADAAAIAQGHQSKTAQSGLPLAIDVSAFAEPIWWATKTMLRSAYRVQLPTVNIVERVDMIIDAEDGRVLRARPVAFFQAAPAGGHAFEWFPEEDLAGLVDVTLVDLLENPPGAPLEGAYFRTANCCRAYVCLDGTEDCDHRDMSVARCATSADANPLLPTLDVPVDADFIPADLGVDTFYVRADLCAELPKVRSTASTGFDAAGWFPVPVDNQGDNASEDDDFAEVQAYYVASTFFRHVRDAMDDPAYCFGGNSMACNDDGSPALGADGRPTRPFHIGVNALVPDVDLQALAVEFLTGNGTGTTPENPLSIGQTRFSNAAFVPAGNLGDLISLPAEFSGLLAPLQRDFDSVLLFQGEERDFAYDGSVVLHELVHAITYGFNPDLNRLTTDTFGSSAEPGALHEAYADFFSASFRDDPQVGQYAGQTDGTGEARVRSLLDDVKCPADTIGEVHADGVPYSAALWDIRELVREQADGIEALERVLWMNLAQSESDETFTKHIDRLLPLLAESFDESVVDAAEGFFVERGVRDCQRVVALQRRTSEDDDAVPTFESTAKERLLLSGLSAVGVDTYVPSPVQFRVEVPAYSTDGIRLEWDQRLLSAFDTGIAPDPVTLQIFVVETDEPIAFEQNGTSLNASSIDGPLTFSPGAGSAADDSNPSRPSFNYLLDAEDGFGRCETRTFHIIVANTSDTLVSLSNVQAIIQPNDNEELTSCEDPVEPVIEDEPGNEPGAMDLEDDGDGCDCQSATSPIPPVAGGFLLFIYLGCLRTRKRSVGAVG